MHISGLKQSKFLTRADVGTGALLTIKEVYQENVAKEGAPEELKWCIAFNEVDKPMVLNATNGQIMAQIVGSEETDNWAGHKVVLYDDPNVSFGGKLVGGIRCRAPRNQPKTGEKTSPRAVSGAAQAQPARQALPPIDPGPAEEPDDVPF